MFWFLPTTATTLVIFAFLCFVLFHHSELTGLCCCRRAGCHIIGGRGHPFSLTHVSSDTATFPSHPHPCPLDFWPTSHPHLSHFLLNPRPGCASKEPSFTVAPSLGAGVPIATELSSFPGLSRGQSWKAQTCGSRKKNNKFILMFLVHTMTVPSSFSLKPRTRSFALVHHL